MNFRILIAEDEDITRKHLIYALTREGYEVTGARNGREALDKIEAGRFDVLITDVKMPGLSGMELLKRVKEQRRDMEVLVITGFGSIDAAVDAMKLGAYEYITKPFNLDELIIKIKNLHERAALKRENVALKTCFEMDKGVSIVAKSAAMAKIIEVVEEIRDSDCRVLITGEAGTGKRLLARIIHFTSRRRNMPFLSVNCDAFSADALHRELFGAEQSAAPGTQKPVQGLLQIAHSGSLFIDNVDTLDVESQLSLLKTIDEGEVPRRGPGPTVRTNVRILAACRTDVKKLAEQNVFSAELYYRLNTVEICIPPLRERKEDIEPLAPYFLNKFAGDRNTRIEGFEPESLRILNDYSYPGNVRELENIVERSAMLEKGPFITPASLPRTLKMYRIETFPPDRIQTIDEITRGYAERVVELSDGDKQKAASLLGISELELRRILKLR